MLGAVHNRLLTEVEGDAPTGAAPPVRAREVRPIDTVEPADYLWREPA